MEFQSWARKNDLWENHYDAFFRESRDLHRDYAPVIRAVDYYNEIVLRGVEAFTLAEYVRGFLTQAERNGEVTAPALKSINRLISSFYKDYHQPVDERLFSALLPLLVREPPEGGFASRLLRNSEKIRGGKAGHQALP